MKSVDPILYLQLPMIQKIIQDETWLEGERRGCFVRSDDHIVRARVCEIVLRIGQQLRDSLSSAGHPPPASAATDVPPPPTL